MKDQNETSGEAPHDQQAQQGAFGVATGSPLTDTERLNWLFEHGYAIVPERGAGCFASEIFDTRDEMDAYIKANNL